MSPLETLPVAERPRRRLPPWLKRPMPEPGMLLTEGILSDLRLQTVCESARCPNRTECWSQQTATFMILGSICTRSCGYCNVATKSFFLLKCFQVTFNPATNELIPYIILLKYLLIL